MSAQPHCYVNVFAIPTVYKTPFLNDMDMSGDL